jgi:hypothetical protein
MLISRDFVMEANMTITLTTLVSFTGDNGAKLQASLIADAHGNLFGTTQVGGVTGEGTVF